MFCDSFIQVIIIIIVRCILKCISMRSYANFHLWAFAHVIKTKAIHNYYAVDVNHEFKYDCRQVKVTARCTMTQFLNLPSPWSLGQLWCQKHGVRLFSITKHKFNSGAGFDIAVITRCNLHPKAQTKTQSKVSMCVQLFPLFFPKLTCRKCFGSTIFYVCILILGFSMTKRVSSVNYHHVQHRVQSLSICSYYDIN